MTRVRVGTGLDEDAALAVWQAAEAGAGRRNGGSRAQRVRARLRSPSALLLVAERDGEPVGVLLAELDRRDGLLVGLLAVAPAAQRSGIGRALLAALLERYPQAGARVTEPDDAVRGLLAAAGLQPTTADHEPGSLFRQRRTGAPLPP